MAAKYIKTKDKEIIIFGEIMLHSNFKVHEPVSAGFISFGIDKETGNPTCSCHGQSISLNLLSDEEDSKLARTQLGFSYY